MNAPKYFILHDSENSGPSKIEAKQVKLEPKS